MLKDLFNRITKSAKNEIQPNTYSEEYYAGMRMAMGYNSADYGYGLIGLVKYMFSQERKQKEKNNNKENQYFIKINTSANSLQDEDFVCIVHGFRDIAENFCDLFKFDTDNLQINILSASSGCFNINFGINLNVKEFNIVKFPGAEVDLITPIVEFLTNKTAESYQDKPIQLLKDCITGYLTKKIPADNEKIKYIDMKKSQEAKRTIIRTIQKQPNTDSVVLDGSCYKSSELDMVV
jgi:hypothetical protein